MFYETGKSNHGLAIDPFKAVVVPRPIAWISTLSPMGVANLAPYSFFNAISESPYFVAFGSDGYKDTIRNIEATGEFAVNLANFELREQMNLSSTQQAGDEFVMAGLEKAACQLIKAPRVALSPTTLECKYFQTIPLPDDSGMVNRWMVIGRVIGVHIADQFIENDRVNSAAMKPLVRLGYSEYATIEHTWRMRR
jgi:flavin reductase (DIM6/NTAB) family NADH-FMN oxidoreductase RutF